MCNPHLNNEELCSTVSRANINYLEFSTWQICLFSSSVFYSIIYINMDSGIFILWVKPNTLFILLFKLFYLWTLGSSSRWLLYTFDIPPSIYSLVFSYFLELHMTPDSSCIFPALVLEISHFSRES